MEKFSINKKIKILFLESSVSTDIKYLILLMPLWWFLGIGFMIFHLVSFWMFVKLIWIKNRRGEKINFPFEVSILLFFILLYLSSIILNIHNIPGSRLLATLYNLSFWCMGLLILIVVYNSNIKDNLYNIIKSIHVFGILTSIFVIVLSCLWFFGVKNLQFNVLSSYLFGNLEIITKAPLLRLFMYPTIIFTDWIFDSQFPRVSGFEIYPTTLGGIMLFIIPVTQLYYRMRKKFRKFGLVLLCELCALLLSFSRISILALILSGIIVGYYSATRRFQVFIKLQFALLISVVVLFLIPPQKIVEPIIKFREGSSETRFALYKLTLSGSIKEFFLGYGYKPREEGELIPRGSHSMYMGVIYKTGFFGFSIFFLFWILVIKRWIQLRCFVKINPDMKNFWKYSGVILFGGLIWMLTEDLDATPTVAFFYFFVISMIVSLKKQMMYKQIAGG